MLQPSDQVLYLACSQLSTRIGKRSLILQGLLRGGQPPMSTHFVAFEQAVDLFEGDEVGAHRWLTTAKKALENQTPLAYSRTELGAREVENLIGRLEHGVFA